MLYRPAALRSLDRPAVSSKLDAHSPKHHRHSIDFRRDPGLRDLGLEPRLHLQALNNPDKGVNPVCTDSKPPELQFHIPEPSTFNHFQPPRNVGALNKELRTLLVPYRSFVNLPSCASVAGRYSPDEAAPDIGVELYVIG